MKDRILNNSSTDTIIQQLNNIITKNAENSGSDQLFRIAFDLIPVPSNNDAKIEFYNQKECWTYRKQITLEIMINSYKTFINNENKKPRA